MKKIDRELKKIFKTIFGLDVSKVNKKTNYKTIKKWDSLNHVKLIMAIESTFKISIDPDEGINFINYEIILKYLKKNVK